MADISDPITGFTGGMTHLGSNYSKLTDAEKIALFEKTSTAEATIDDLKLLGDFRGHMYYTDN